MQETLSQDSFQLLKTASHKIHDLFTDLLDYDLECISYVMEQKRKESEEFSDLHL